ncbi:MAG: PP2C family protein-serine/threonine phosphatase [Balneolales bacterium]|nr:PP2C family protein-serine/threonine phosphatase [Balneolales bacterium]
MLIESHDTDFILNNLLLIVMGKLMVPKAAILLVNYQSNRLKAGRCKGRLPFSEGDSWDPAVKELPYDKSLYSAAELATQLPEIVNSAGFSHYFPIRTSSEHLGYLCISLKAGKREHGPKELEFIENLVIIFSVALSNSFLVGRLKSTNRELDEKVQELNTLFDVSREFNTMVDRSQMLNVFRFTLMGQMFIKKFFLLMCVDKQPFMVVQHGVKGEMNLASKSKLLEMEDECIEVSSLADADPFLTKNEIFALVRVRFQDETAVLGISERMNRMPYRESDYNFLISLGNLAFLSIQKTYLLEERIEKERMEEELSIARTIQNTLFPNPLPKVDDLEIAALNIPSQQVGGDYYDALISGKRYLYTAIADVTGKGIPASLLMANLQAMIHVLSPLQLPLDETTGKVNDIMFKNTPSDKFISFFWGRLDTGTRLFEYCNAGHNPPVRWNQQTQKTELLSAGGMLLGALSTMMPYEQGSFYLQQGDVVVMFTDGISEAMNEEEEEFGEERIAWLLEENHHKSAAEIQSIILEEVRVFCNGNYGDDVTMLILKAE